VDFGVVNVGEQNARTHSVRNVEWVHAFAWILPLADRRTLQNMAQLVK
jgi:hypothetical protein